MAFVRQTINNVSTFTTGNDVEQINNPTFTVWENLSSSEGFYWDIGNDWTVSIDKDTKDLKYLYQNVPKLTINDSGFFASGNAPSNFSVGNNLTVGGSLTVDGNQIDFNHGGRITDGNGFFTFQDTDGSAGFILAVDTQNENQDSTIGFQENGVTKWVIGNDGSDSDTFKIGPSFPLGSASSFEINTSGSITIPSAQYIRAGASNTAVMRLFDTPVLQILGATSISNQLTISADENTSATFYMISDLATDDSDKCL